MLGSTSYSIDFLQEKWVMGKLKVHGNQKYPWEKWLKEGTTHTLTRGKQFDVQVHSFIVNLYQRVKKSGVKVKVEYLGDTAIRLSVIKKQRRRSA